MRRLALLALAAGCPKPEAVVTAQLPAVVPYVDAARPLEAGTPEQIGDVLPIWLRPSGVAWHPGLRGLVVVDDKGHLAVVRPRERPQVFQLGGPLQAVVVPDPASNTVLVGLADPDTLIEVDAVTGRDTGRTWTLTSWLEAPGALSGLAWVPNGQHPFSPSASGGLVYAAHDATGTVHVLDVRLDRAEEVTEVGRFQPVPGRAGLVALHYEAATGQLLSLYADRLVESWANGSLTAEYTLPAADRRGVTEIAACAAPVDTLVFAEAEGAMWRFPSHPAVCP